MSKLILIAILFYCSCSKKENAYSKIIHNTDKIQIIRNKSNFDTSLLIEKRTLDAFKDVFNNYEEACPCEPTGKLIFYNKDSILLEVETSQYDGKCEYFIIGSGENKKCYRFNYRTGMFLSEI